MATKRPVNIYSCYHAHVYFDSSTLARAAVFCDRAGKQFGVQIGRVHEKLVGPHTRWSCQIAFDATQFDRLIPWLDQQREGLSILVHGITGNDLEDHTTHATWLGDSVPLNLAIFQKSSPATA